MLQLDEFEVVHQAEDVAEKTLRFTVVPKVEAAVCPHCGASCGETHQTRDRDGIRDLPIGERAVVLRVREFRCDACGRCFTPAWKSMADGTHATERFLERATAIVRQGDVSNAARLCGVPEKTLERWYYEYVERRQRRSDASFGWWVDSGFEGVVPWGNLPACPIRSHHPRGKLPACPKRSRRTGPHPPVRTATRSSVAYLADASPGTRRSSPTRQTTFGQRAPQAGSLPHERRTARRQRAPRGPHRPAVGLRGGAG